MFLSLFNDRQYDFDSKCQSSLTQRSTAIFQAMSNSGQFKRVIEWMNVVPCYQITTLYLG